MQEASGNSPFSGPMMDPDIHYKLSPVKSYSCSQCSLVFASMISLCQHVTDVHGVNKKNDGACEITTSEEFFPCTLCQANLNSDDLREHEVHCKYTSLDTNETVDETEYSTAAENQENEVGAISSTSNSVCSVNSSKDLKTYKNPLQIQTITKYFAVVSKPSGKPSVKIPERPTSLDGTKGTLLLQQSPSDPSQNGSGVFKVTAKIDMADTLDRCLLQEALPEPVVEKNRKRTILELPQSHSVKVAKARVVKMKPSNEESARTQPSSSSDFSFEVSEDEEERTNALPNGDTGSPNLYFCKHCDYSDSVIRRMSFHYQNDHPYVRCSVAYIQDPRDRSVAFRCLECPIEFLGLADLEKHYSDKHPNAQTVFMRHSWDLGYKCFVCPFVTNDPRALKEHYWQEHPQHKADNSLLYCKYTVNKEELPQPDISGKYPSPETAGRTSPSVKNTQHKEFQKAPSPVKSNSGEDVVMYHCSSCKFSHKSPSGVHFHYLKHHPKEVVMIEEIRQTGTSHATTQRNPERSGKTTETPSTKRSTTESSTSKITDSSTPSVLTRRSTSKRSSTTMERSTPPTVTENSTPLARTDSSTPKSSTTTESSTSRKSTIIRVSSTPPMIFECSTSKGSTTTAKSSTPPTITESSTAEMSEAIPESSVPQKNIPEAGEFKAKGREQRDSVPPLKLSIALDTLEICSESPQMEKGKSAEDGKKTKPPSSKSNQEPSAGSSSNLDDKVFFCQFCDFSNTNIRSVVAHHNMKHAEQGTLSTEEVWWFNHKLPKKKMRRECETPSSVASSPSESRKGDDMPQEKKPKIENRTRFATSNHKVNPYDTTENLFYCPHCNFANPGLKGVMGHQAHSHPTNAIPQEDVDKYSIRIRAEIKRSKSDLRESFSPVHLPLPILCKGDETCYFCYLCNFRNNAMTAVTGHFFKRHHGVVAKPDAIIDYSSRLLKHMGVDPLKPSTNSGHGPVSLGESNTKKLNKQKPESSSASPSRSVTTPETERVLNCYRCLYTTPVVNVLRRHMANVHGSSRSSLAILKLFYREGKIGTGYHCDSCVFSHQSATGLFKHIQEHHPKRNFSLKQISTNLFVGPESVPPIIKGQAKTKPVSGNGSGRTSLSQRPNRIRSRMYWCRACSFKAKSMFSVITHCHAAHPWAVKDDGSYLNVVTTKKQNANSMVGDEELVSFSNSQAALNHRSSRGSSRDEFDCQYCPISYDSEHKLQSHCERTHSELQSMRWSESLHVFKCPHCTYINSKYTGVATHCQMRHSECESKVASHYLDDAHVQCWSGERSKFRGYLCHSCPEIIATPEKLLKHHGKEHRITPDTVVQPAHKQFSAKKHPHAYSSLGSLSKASFLNIKKYAKIKCPHCKYLASTKIGLESHIRMNHRSSSSSGSKDSQYKCNLCSSTYMVKGRLKRHYIGKHGKNAYLKYQAVWKSLDSPTTQSHVDISESNPKGSDPQMLVYKCPCCSYVNTSFHGTLTHCQMRHPKIVVRADALQTALISTTNLRRGSGSKGSNQKGFMCSECPQILESLFRLQIHVGKCHNQPEPVKSEGDHKTSLPFQCNLCSHATSRRRYLLGHYRSFHKLDSYSRSKQLEKYNKRKFNITTKEGNVACKKCTDVYFETPQLLLHHYTKHHSSDIRRDFTILKKKTKKNKGLYRCQHCRDVLTGDWQLSLHLDHHREAIKAKSDAASSKVSRLNESLETKEEQDLVAEEISTLEPSPTPSPSRSTDQEPLGLDSIKYTCEQCGRNFMSLKGLRSHERGHVAFDKLDKASTSVIEANLNKLVIYKPGTIRPFLCKVCSYRTTVYGLWRSHFIRKHQGVKLNDETPDNEVHEKTLMTEHEPLAFPEENSNLTQPEVEVKMIQSSLYLEPQDVQRQLNHYNSMVRNNPRADQQEAPLPGSDLLYCDFCTFSSSHMSSVRRHYINRHGRKMLKCKECEFITGSRKTLAMHMEQGHSRFQPKPTNHSSLRCPFCLYQTKSKNSMIDHIDLHREERVVPIEVRRSKLSRLLQGLIFRCHKCTFSCGSPESLRAHVRKHDDIKPYKCRLCFFDCAQLGDLEAHLSDKHQVVRNHELVGQVNLDKLEARTSQIHNEDMDEEENLQQHGSEIDNIKIESVTSCHEVPHEAGASDSAESCPRQKTMLQVREARLRRKGNATPLQSERHDTSEEEMETDESQTGMRGGDEMSTRQKQTPLEGSSATLAKTVDKRESIKLNFKILQQRNIESRAEDKILRDILVLDAEGGGLHKTHKTAEGTERNGECKDLENVLNELLDEEHLIALSHIPTIRMNSEAKKDRAHEAPSRSQEGIKCESLSPTSLPSCAQLTARRDGDSDTSLINCKEEEVSVHGSSDELTDPYGEMPVLENEYLREAAFSPLSCKEEEEEEEEEDEGYDCVGQRHKADQAVTDRAQTSGRGHEEGGGVQEAGGPHGEKGVIATEEEASGQKLYTCELCGRSLTSDTDLKHHITRHGM